MAQTYQLILLSTLYSVLAMFLVSLDATYNITYTLFGNLVGATDQASYGTGMSIKQKGFLLHLVVFALLIAIPMLVTKNN